MGKVLAVACLVVGGSLASTALAAESDSVGGIKAEMRGNFEALLDLQPLVVDPEKFRDPENRAQIEKNLEKLSKLKHVISAQLADQEPGMGTISGLFTGYLRGIQADFKAGNTSGFVRNRIRTLSSLCMGCHTRTRLETTFDDFSKKVESVSVTAQQKAELLAATRQFDKALTAYAPILANPPESDGFGYMDLSDAIRQVLTITVRVKADPRLTETMLEKVAARKDLPEFYQEYVALWRKDVREWTAEKALPRTAAASAVMTRARALSDRARARQRFATDPAGDIFLLRAVGLVHEALMKEPKGKFRGDALYLLGSAYDSLNYPMLWGLDTLYFESCVREFAHTPIARKCYDRFATKTYFNSSGSGGTFVSEEDARKLAELRKLAH